MSNKSSIEPIKSTIYWSIFSIILGIISMVLTFLVMSVFDKRHIVLGMLLPALCAILGLVLAVKELKFLNMDISVLWMAKYRSLVNYWDNRNFYQILYLCFQEQRISPCYLYRRFKKLRHRFIHLTSSQRF
jgi:hypothetical protein